MNKRYVKIFGLTMFSMVILTCVVYLPLSQCNTHVESSIQRDAQNANPVSQNAVAVQNTQEAEAQCKEQTTEIAPETEVEEPAIEDNAAEDKAEDKVEQTYTYTDIDANKYTTESLNVRSMPSTDGDIIDALAKKQQIHVISQCNETGWYKIDYDGITGYVSNKYVSDEKPQEQGAKVVEQQTAEAKETNAPATETADTITDTYYNDIIYADGTVPTRRLKKLNDELSLVPSNLLAHFKQNGYTIKMTNQDIGQMLFNGLPYVSGAIQTGTKTIYIKNTDKAIKSATVHEFGHYLDYMIAYTSNNNSDFQRAYEAEKADLKSNFGLNRADIGNVNEYYASCFYAYIMDGATMQAVAPQSYEFIKNDMGKI